MEFIVLIILSLIAKILAPRNALLMGTTVFLILLSVKVSQSLPDAAAAFARKALFVEDFEMDVYEWMLMEPADTKEQTPNLLTTDEADQGRNVLLFQGKKGILGLELTRKVRGIVEFRVKFPEPHDYTRMFAVGLKDNEVLLGVNRSNKINYVLDGVWQTTEIPVGLEWHTFTYDFSGGVARIYVDGKLVIITSGLREIDRIRLGVNNSRGGRCLLDTFVIYDTNPDLTEDNTVEVRVPLLTWDSGLKTLHGEPPHTTEGVSYRVVEEAHRGKYAGELNYAANAKPKEWLHWNPSRSLLLPGLPRKVSIWMYGDGSGIQMLLNIRPPNNALGYYLPPVTWIGWKELEVDLTRQADTRYYSQKATMSGAFEGTRLQGVSRYQGTAGKPARVLIDDIVLTTRLNRDSPYQFYTECTAEDNVLAPGEPVGFRTIVGNFSKTDKVFTLYYAVEDFWQKLLQEGKLEVSVPAGRQHLKLIQLSGKPLPHGWFRMHLSLIDGQRTIASFDDPIAVMRPLPQTAYSAGNPVGHYGGLDRKFRKAGQVEGYLVRLDDIEKRGGVEAVAAWRPSEREMVAMKAGTYTGIVMYIAPKWGFLPDAAAHDAASAWAEKMAELAAALKGLPIYYKILAEPNNTGFSYQRCYDVLKYAIQGLKKGDPEAKIIALNTSKFDWGRQKAVWQDGVLLKNVYAVGVHPYTGPRHGSHKPERVHGIGNLASMLRLDDMIRRYNNGQPRMIWASEVGLSTRQGLSFAVTWQEQANYLARALIQYKTMGNFGRIHYHHMWEGKEQWGLFTEDNQPKSAIPALHTITERITDVTFLKALKTPENIRAYLFQKNGKQMLAAWCVEGQQTWSLPIACPSVTVMDLMGVYHQRQVNNGQLTFYLTQSPVFASPSDGKRLCSAWVQADRRYREIVLGQSRRLTVMVRNDRAELLSGTLKPILPEGMWMKPTKQSIRLLKGERKIFEFMLSIAPNCLASFYQVWFELTGARLDQSLAQTRVYIDAVRPETNLSATRVTTIPVVDGKLNDPVWKKAVEFVNFLNDNNGFRPLLKQKLRLLYHNSGLYLGLEFEKKAGQEFATNHIERDDPNLWRDEGLEVFIDSNLDRSNYVQLVANMRGVQSDYKYVDTASKKRNLKSALSWNGYWIVRTDESQTEWTAEVFVPWATIQVIGSKPISIGINVSRKHAPSDRMEPMSYTPDGIGVHEVELYKTLTVDLSD